MLWMTSPSLQNASKNCQQSSISRTFLFRFKSGPPSTTTQESTTSTKSTTTQFSTKPTTKTTTKFTTRTSSKPTSTDWRPETTATTDLIATAAPQDGHSQTALIVGLVMGVLVLVAIIAVSLVTVKKRNIKIPGIDAVRGLINPGYSKFDDGAMVRPLDSLRAKLECLSFPGQFEGIVFPGE